MGKLLSFRFAEKGFTVLALFLYTEALLRPLLSGGANENARAQIDSAPIQLTFFLIYLITAGLLALRWKKVLALLQRDRFIWVLLALVALSTLWSVEPDITLRRSIALIGTYSFGIYMASRYTVKEQLQLLAWACGLVIALSFVFAIALPKYGVSSGLNDGAWRGVFSHKNGLARKMTISIVVFSILALDARGLKRFFLFGGVSLSLVLLILAQSTTALGTLVAALGVLVLCFSLRWRYSVMLPSILLFLSIAAFTGLWLVDNLEPILASLGEDVTLTGRTGFWPLVIHKIQERPWFGYGYEAFWRGLNGESAYIYHTGMTPSHAHNGLLQLWLHVGFVGVATFLVGLWFIALKALTWVRLTHTAVGLWPFVYLTMLIIPNIAESSLLAYNDFDGVLFSSIALSVLNLPDFEWGDRSFLNGEIPFKTMNSLSGEV